MLNSRRGFSKVFFVVALVAIIMVALFFVKNLSKSNGNFTNIKPMYGAEDYKSYITNRSEEIKKIDETFVRSALSQKNLVDATDGIFGGALSYIEKDPKDFDTAMKRCNQVWLLDHERYTAYLCFGMILREKGDSSQAQTYFLRAAERANENLKDVTIDETNRERITYSLIYIYMELGKYEEARKLLNSGNIKDVKLKAQLREIDATLKIKGF